MAELLKNLTVEYFFGNKITITEKNNDSKPKPMESAVYSKFFYIVDGLAVFKINDKEYIVSKGDLILIPPNIPHRWDFLRSNGTAPQKITMAGFHFNLQTKDSDLFKLLFISYVCHVDNHKYIIELFNKIFKSAQNENFSAKLKIISYILSILAYFLDHTTLPANDPPSSVVYKIMEHIKTHLNHPINITELADLSGWTPTHLIRVFKQHTGYTPLQFALWTKMNYSVGLIENTTTPISEILEKTGFYDAAHFSKVFKRFFGLSPTEYRKKYLNEKNKSTGVINDDINKNS